MGQIYQQCWSAINSWVLSLNRQEWLILLVAVTVAGFFCMRGFGSRSNY